MQALAYQEIGNIYAKQGKYEEALQAYLKSETIYTTVLTTTAIDDVSRLYAAMAHLGLTTNDPELAQLYTRQHSDLFGLAHPRTMKLFAAGDERGMRVVQAV